MKMKEELTIFHLAQQEETDQFLWGAEKQTTVIAATRWLVPRLNSLAVSLLTTWIPSKEEGESEAFIFTFREIDTSNGSARPQGHGDI